MKPKDLKFIFGQYDFGYKWYKLSIAVYLFLMCFAGFIFQLRGVQYCIFCVLRLRTQILHSSWKQLNPRGVHGYFDFYSNSIEVAVTIWSLLNLYLVFFPDSHCALYAITAGFNAIAPTAAAYLCFCYWAFSPETEITFFSMHQHVFLCAITFIDLLMIHSPLRWDTLWFSLWIPFKTLNSLTERLSC